MAAVGGYREWWKSSTASPTPEQRAILWASVPNANAYAVIETKLVG